MRNAHRDAGGEGDNEDVILSLSCGASASIAFARGLPHSPCDRLVAILFDGRWGRTYLS
jgi:hypothetical protein